MYPVNNLFLYFQVVVVVVVEVEVEVVVVVGVQLVGAVVGVKRKK
jgi:hypothetical protein